ncbi:histidine kinase [Flavobacterium sp.]|uniref:sensor histidine kinase n=1 Tax=Flavobacterium sp. TaxID=239 RepID=UPI00262FE1EE|nr:histidine kinase [Flavobacterium sp.]
MDGTNEVKSIFFIGTFLMLFLAFGMLFLVLFYQRHLTKIKKKEAEILLKTALKSEKKERKRIAKDLHDAIQSDLIAIRNYIHLFSKKNRVSPSPELLSTIQTSLNQAIENTRLISYQLMPPLLETLGFNLALCDYFEQLSASTGKDFKIELQLEDNLVSDKISYELFRVVQELASNMLKHGSITYCVARLSNNQKGVCFELIDDGIPFDFMMAYRHAKGTGLKNIKSRLQSIAARLEQKNIEKGNHYIIYLSD